MQVSDCVAVHGSSRRACQSGADKIGSTDVLRRKSRREPEGALFWEGLS